MKPPRWKIEIAASRDESKLRALGQKKSLHHYVGWKSEMFRPRERCFFLTSPFIELLGTWLGARFQGDVDGFVDQTHLKRCM
jgi:hypothetical protein